MSTLYGEEAEEGVDDVELDFEPEPDEPSPEAKPAGPDPRIEMAKKILQQVHETLGTVISLLDGTDVQAVRRQLTDLVTTKKEMETHLEDVSGSRIIEGVFDGMSMIGSDGKSYSVPPNYASKSRLVEGDILKLTIKKDGIFLYKQIGPIERRRIIGCVAFDASSGSHVVLCGDFTFKVLTASVTYFRGQPGDEAVVLVPKSTPSVWAAVENIVKK